jgi:hypothetical protein
MSDPVAIDSPVGFHELGSECKAMLGNCAVISKVWLARAFSKMTMIVKRV